MKALVFQRRRSSEMSDAPFIEDPSDSQEHYLESLRQEFRRSFLLLGSPSEAQITSMASFIYDCMSNPNRNYHGVQHLFDFIYSNVCLETMDGIAVLSILFHDCIYSSVDGGFSQTQSKKLAGSFVDQDGVLKTHPDSHQDRYLRMLLQLFRLSPGEPLNNKANEYLSAVIAVRELKSIVDFTTLIEVAACIEATVPFRGPVSLQDLYENIRSISDSFDLRFSDSRIVKMVQRAAVISNEDIGNFATKDHRVFLDASWSLMPETNEHLRDEYCSIMDLQFAVFKFRGLYKFLNRDNIFKAFEQVPTPQVLDMIATNSEVNIAVGRKYVAARLLTLSFLAAVAVLTGGDMPLQEILSPRRRKLGNLPELESTHEDCDPRVLRILETGRLRDFCFDARKSPLAAFFHASVGDAAAQTLLDTHTVYPMTKETAHAILRELPRSTVLAALKYVVHRTASREAALQKLWNELQA